MCVELKWLVSLLYYLLDRKWIVNNFDSRLSLVSIKNAQILWYQLLTCEDLLFFYDSKLNIFEFWTGGRIKQTRVCRYHSSHMVFVWVIVPFEDQTFSCKEHSKTDNTNILTNGQAGKKQERDQPTHWFLPAVKVIKWQTCNQKMQLVSETMLGWLMLSWWSFEWALLSMQRPCQQFISVLIIH